MDILITNSSDKPLYEQIIAQIKQQILSGMLQEGEMLPSMRLLAKELRISVITTKRAYEELEREGFIITMTGRGSFVAPKNLEIIKEERLKQIEELLCKAIEVASTSNIPLSDIQDMLQLLCKEEL